MNIFKLFFSFEGKIHRLPFLVAHIVYWLIFIALGFYFAEIAPAVYDSALALKPPSTELYMNVKGFVSLLIIAVVVYSTICVYIKRLRDTNHDTLFTTMILIAPINAIIFIYLLFCPSR